MNANATYPLNTMAKAAGLTERQIRRKREHGFLPMQRCDKPSTGSGHFAGYSRNRILQAAIMRWLATVNVPASAASAAALVFSDEGQTGRAAGECFKHGKTILIVTSDGAVVRNIPYGATLADVTDGSVCAVTLEMNKITENVDKVLDSERAK